MYHFGKDIAIKVGIMYQLKKTINSTLETLEKAHKRNKRGGGGGDIPPEMEYGDEQEERWEEEFEDLDSEMEERDVSGNAYRRGGGSRARYTLISFNTRRRF